MAEKKSKSIQQSPQPPKIHIPPDVGASYANLVRIAHTPSELMFDFARFLPGDPSAPVVSRIIMSPLGAKLFVKALNDNLAKYEATYGEIVIPKKHSLADSLFKPLQPPDEPPEDGKK